MPSGPKKRRASRRKKGGIVNADEGEGGGGGEENLELHESLSNVLETSFGVQKADLADNEIGSKGSQPVDIQTGLKNNVKETEVVGKCESVLVDRIDLLEAPLNEPNSKNHEESECGEVGDGTTVVMKKGDRISMEGVLEESLKELIERSSDEVQEMVNTVDLDQSMVKVEVQDSSVPVTSMSETNVETSLKYGQDPLRSSFVLDVSPVDDVEGFVHKTEFTEVGESTHHIDSVMKEGRDHISTECIVVEEEPLEKPIAVQAAVKSIYKWVMKVIPSIDTAEDPSVLVESFPEAKNLETSIIDSFEEPPVSPAEVGKSTFHVESVINEDGDMSMKDVAEEPQTMNGIVDELVMEKETQEPCVQDKSVIEVNVEMSFKDAQDSSRLEPLKNPSLGQVTFVANNGHLNGYESEPIKCSSNETQALLLPIKCSMDDMSHVEDVVQEAESTEFGESETLIEFVKEEDDEMSTDKGVVKERLEEPIGHDQPQDMVKSVNHSVIEVNADSKDSFNNKIGSSSMVDMSRVEGITVGNNCSEEDERASHYSPTTFKHAESVMKENEEMSIEGVLEEEPSVRSSDEQHIMVKTIDQESVMKDARDTCVSLESIIESNIETSSKEAQDPYHVDVLIHVEGVVQEKDFIEFGKSAHDPPPIANYVDSNLKEDEGMSMESVVQDSFKDPTGRSLDDPQVTIKTGDQSILKLIPSREAQDLSVPDHESVTKLNVETSFGDGQEYFTKPLGGSSLVDVSPGQWNGQQDEMVRLLRTLLEEIRRIRVFYEEGLHQTTEIYLHICQLLEKFDSGQQI